ncbi:MAG TPA: nicotinate-nucleotide--dimethylbenzimidazole phosphoribosyltransferase [Pararhodobacter sp.]|uniref:nicotinate-nucleotide--dimethylbenzimidazole phosphoribosyltransferase n=1 Tax=Pararhodobacter sp. TaxID=2127056 RepID=UPI002C5B3357|nr:nicotinate-nucleotide--dimethylbenzimidazole phosphoribosyltransferase [Pararhodobacter sp.]HPD92796.1 nicotinate-nucleotide--dimethylbenzimidazole phosphoribosyltransferase [Pararhodobacter sp.]
MTDSLAARIRHTIDTKTKPLGALGRIEQLAEQIALVQGTTAPVMSVCTLTIFAADHGIADAGVSTFPQVVTGQMVLNFLSGGAAANVFARVNGVGLQVVDAGVAGAPIAHPDLIDRRVGAGTANFLDGPAMSAAQAQACLDHGADIARKALGEALAFGEMGIANTATAAALAHKLTGLPLIDLVGRGTGLDDAGVRHKLAVLERACGRTGALSPAQAMAEYGGFEIVMMAGAMLETAHAGRIVMVDGFIATAAATLACALEPGCRAAMVFAHRSHESGHRVLLAHLGATPLLDLDMRLGEGTGALLAWPLLKAAAAMMSDMASFEAAGVSNRD